MMDASSPMSDVTSLLASGHGDHNETTASGGGLVDMLLAPVSSFSASSASDFFIDPDMPSIEDENWIRVPANWLDAMPADLYEQDQRDQDAITACNSDDNGLYRMFRNLSP